jgi:ABC-type lipoprotein export system ATPase subunit
MAIPQTDIANKAAELLDLLDDNEELAIQAIKNQHTSHPKPSQSALLSPSNVPNQIISTNSLTKTYQLGKQTVTAVNNVSIGVGKGEFVAITGASGSGKSTLLQLMGGLDKPSNGQVVVDGDDISGLSDKQLSIFRNTTIGFIFQFFYLQPFLTLSQNIEIPAMPSRMKPDLRKTRTVELLEAVGLTSEGDHRPHQLSGGQIQRAAIARALYNNPKIILADEPTGNLDSNNSKLIVDLLMDIRQKFGTTVVIVTHDHKIATQADRVITMADGELV